MSVSFVLLLGLARSPNKTPATSWLATGYHMGEEGCSCYAAIEMYSVPMWGSESPLAHSQIDLISPRPAPLSALPCL
jgi:hypothetical protein